jgi:putative membrane protein
MFEFRRQHPVAVVSQLFEGIKQNIIPILIFLFAGSRNSNDYFWVIVLFGLISSFILGIVSWYRFKFRIHEDELQIDKGIFVRKKLYLKKDRIQVIDITEGIIQRIFGLVQVEIKTAGGGTEKATISALTKEEATDLRSILRDHANTSNEVESSNADVNVEPILEWKLSSRDLFYAALTSGNFGLIASILGVVSGQLDQFITDENLDYIASILPGYSQLSTILWGVAIIFFISYLLSFFGVILRYSDFKIEKKENELLVTSGLLERKHTTVPFNRIQAFRFVEGIFRQPFGYGMLFVESAGFEQKENDRSIVLLPFVKKEYLRPFLEEFVGEIEKPGDVIKPPKRSLFRYIRRPNYMLILAIPLLWFIWDYAWTLFFLILPLSLFGWLEYQDAEVRVGKKIIQFQYRVLAKTTALVRHKRAQVSELSINPFQSRKHLATIHFTAASGAGGKTFSVTDLDSQDAQSILQWTLPDTK